ncbi:AAA-type ATPase [Parasponia andersonii]|uniref:AAA-type ATPase n=1 Tax=Parasponia andersonii TaxID=3476 RepID=A0A2P5C1M4_PARAD|nr:AAA-type ATPase [Parasponia andersonii]
MWDSKEMVPSARTILSVAASLTASAVLFRTIANDLVPDAVQELLSTRLFKLCTRLSPHVTIVIDGFDGLTPNQVFEAATVYLGTKLSSSSDIIKTKSQELVDSFNGAKFTWVLVCSRNYASFSNGKRDQSGFARQEMRHYELSVHKKHREVAPNSYLPHVLEKAKGIKEERKRVDKAWKRGNLLYGPPGTGKSSLVAAMANYLKFDIYDLDLKEVQCNFYLRRLLIGTGNQSILVIEDIDCSIELQNRVFITDYSVRSAEFIDGVWSSCGDARIVVFTTNHKDRLNPALLRPGRMDLHLHLSYCDFSGFKILAKNYLQIEEHPLFGEIEKLLNKIQATPAEISG